MKALKFLAPRNTSSFSNWAIKTRKERKKLRHIGGIWAGIAPFSMELTEVLEEISQLPKFHVLF